MPWSVYSFSCILGIFVTFFPFLFFDFLLILSFFLSSSFIYLTSLSNPSFLLFLFQLLTFFLLFFFLFTFSFLFLWILFLLNCHTFSVWLFFSFCFDTILTTWLYSSWWQFLPLYCLFKTIVFTLPSSYVII